MHDQEVHHAVTAEDAVAARFRPEWVAGNRVAYTGAPGTTIGPGAERVRGNCDQRGMAMRTTHCSLYLPGHTVHYIQGRKLGEYQTDHPERCRPVKITDLGAGWFETVIDGDTRLGWNHDPDRVCVFARDSVLGEVVYVPFSGALDSVRRDGNGARTGSYLLYPAWGDSPTKCVHQDLGF